MAHSICFYFQVHQPFRIRPHGTRVGHADHDYFVTDDLQHSNEHIFNKVSEKSYLPTNKLLLELLENHPEFHISFSLSGVFLEQCELYGDVGAQVLESFKKLTDTGRCEILSETYYHSLAFLYSKLEFSHQVDLHRKLVKKHFKQNPKVFRNTELIYRDDLAEFVRLMGYDGIIAEGWHSALPDENRNVVRYNHTLEIGSDDHAIATKYKRTPKAKVNDHIAVLTKNYQLSDDIAFRFNHQPIHADDFAQWVTEAEGDTVNLFMDFETFGEHQWDDTGIFEFLRHLPQACIHKNVGFKTPSQTIESYEPQGIYNAEDFISWADENRDISAWIENDMQRETFAAYQAVEAKLFPLRNSKKIEVVALWADFRKLQTSDHLYYMSTKFWADGDVHTYFSPYDNPYDAYINFMNTLNHLETRIVDVT